MTIEVDWGNHEETIIVMKFLARWTGDEFHSAVVRYQELAVLKTHPVHNIVDMRQALGNPPNVMILVRAALQHRVPNEGKTIIITRTQIWRSLFDSIPKEFINPPLDIDFVATVDEAYAIIDAYQQGN